MVQYTVQFGQHPAPRFSIAHLSDPHLLAGPARVYGAVDAESRLREAITRLGQVDPPPQAIVFTGDLADRGEPEAYARLRAIVEPAATQIGAQVVWTMGNHDERAAYSQALFGAGSEEPQDRVHDVDGLRIVALDSTVPGYHHGNLTEDQLAWLADVLATPAEHGTILALHHPPIPLPMIPVAAVIELEQQERLAAVVRGSDVRLVIGGHFHYTSWSTFAGVPVSVAASTCYVIDPAPGPERLVSGVDGAHAFTMVHLYDDRVVQTAVPVAPAAEVSRIESAMLELAESMPLADLKDQISRKKSEFNTSGADWA